MTLLFLELCLFGLRLFVVTNRYFVVMLLSLLSLLFVELLNILSVLR